MLGLHDLSTEVDLASPINWSHPLNSGRIGWYISLPGLVGSRRMINLVGTPDLSAILTTARPAWVPSTRPGISAAACRYAATGAGYIVTAPARFKRTLPVSFSAWVKPTGTVPVGKDLFGVTYNNALGNPYYGYAMHINGSSYFTIGSNSAGTVYEVASTTVVNNRGWTHIVATISTAAQTLYVDGVQAAQSTTTRSNPNYATTALLFLGAQINTNAALNVDLDDFSVWSRILTINEVRELRDESLRGYPGMLRRATAMPCFPGAAPPAAINPATAWMLRYRRRA